MKDRKRKDKHEPTDESTSPELPVADAAATDPLEAMTAERDDLLTRLQRVSADYLNYQKRVAREKSEARDFTVADTLGSMFDVMDDLALAVNHARENHPADDPLLVGTDMVRRKALEVFKRFGVEAIATEGATFDPSLHEAVVSQPTADAEPMTVLYEVRTGYVMGERTIRPSRVVVAAAIENDDNAPTEPDRELEGDNHADV